MKHYGYIYKTMIGDSFYIGQKKGSFDPSYYGSGVRIQEYIKKYGKKELTIKILAWADSKEELDQLEIKYIAPHLGTELCWNLAKGDDGNAAGWHHREDSKLRIAKSSKQRWKDPKQRQTMIENASKVLKGRTFTKEWKQKLSDAHKGKKNPGKAIHQRNRWNSTEIYKEGLTYREWMSKVHRKDYHGV